MTQTLQSLYKLYVDPVITLTLFTARSSWSQMHLCGVI